MTFASRTQFHIERPGEGPSRCLLRDYEPTVGTFWSTSRNTKHDTHSTSLSPPPCVLLPAAVLQVFVNRSAEQTDVFIICMWDWYIKLIGEITTKMLVFNQETIYNVENVNMKGESLLKLQTIN